MTVTLTVHEANDEATSKVLIETLNELVKNGVMRFDPEKNAYIEIDQTTSPNDLIPSVHSNSNENLVWQADNYSNRFENIMDSDDWIEKIDGRNVYEFKPVRFDKDNGLVLFDPHREVYVALLSHNSFYGTAENNFRPLYLGKWLNNDYEKRLNKLVNGAVSQGNIYSQIRIFC